MPDTKWRVIVHGGAADSCPDVSRQNDIKNALRKIIIHSAKLLEGGAHAKNVVVEAIKELEDCPLFNAGKGSALTRDGTCELDAGIVDGFSGHYAAVSCMTKTKNPILTASALADYKPYDVLKSVLADNYTKHLGLKTVPNNYFVTPFHRAYWERKSAASSDHIGDDTGTVGALVLDIYGHLAAGGSTGGTPGKMNGQVCDTAVLGASLFANDRVAIVCGTGHEILDWKVASKAAEYYIDGLDLARATRRALMDISLSTQTCSIAAIDNRGGVSISSTAKVFYAASMSSAINAESALLPPTLPFNLHHVVYEDSRLAIGLSRYPTTRCHFITQLNPYMARNDLFSLDCDSFLTIFQVMREVAAACRQAYYVQRCALVTEGVHSISIIPLHGLSEKWQQIRYDGKREFYKEFPGYVTSKEGPRMDESKLDEVCRQIQSFSKMVPPFNYNFFGEKSDMNLFALIVRGEVPQRRIWESKHHVAFLTPYPNTLGYTILVPRYHLPSDIFSLNKLEYCQLVEAAHTVGDVLKQSFGAKQIGMIFEGFDIDYAHVKLIPIQSSSPSLQTKDQIYEGEYHDRYPGYVSSMQGPRTWDLFDCAFSAEALRRRLPGILEGSRCWLRPKKEVLN